MASSQYCLLGLVFIIATILIFYIHFQDPTQIQLETGTIQVHIKKTDYIIKKCKVPPQGFKGWGRGVVTALKPEIPRNCTKLFAEDVIEIERVKKASKGWKNAMSDDEFLKRTRNCSWLLEEFSNNLYNTAEERDFPLAFSFTIHKYPQQVVRLIKVLYRPQNMFCVHPDKKSPPQFKEVFENLAKCFDNFMVASTLEDVRWGKYSNFKAQMNCFTDLVKKRPSLPKHQRWKYAIDLCGMELPMKTNHEMVTILKELNGSSLLKPGKVKPKSNLWKRIHGKIPFNIAFYKGYAYNALSHNFAAFLVNDPMGIEVHEFFKNAFCPEELYYGSLFMHPGVPGGYNPEFKDKYFEMAQAIWCFTSKCSHSCYGKMVHSICITAAGDLAKIMKQSGGIFFHNKYVESLDTTVMDCMEERIVQRNMLEYEEECRTPN